MACPRRYFDTRSLEQSLIINPYFLLVAFRRLDEANTQEGPNLSLRRPQVNVKLQFYTCSREERVITPLQSIAGIAVYRAGGLARGMDSPRAAAATGGCRPVLYRKEREGQDLRRQSNIPRKLEKGDKV